MNEALKLEPFKIGATLVQAITDNITWFRDYEAVHKALFDIAIDIATITEYWHHVRRDREHYNLVDIIVAVRKFGLTDTNYLFTVGGIKTPYISSSPEWEHDTFWFYPEIYRPNVGLGMHWIILNDANCLNILKGWV